MKKLLLTSAGIVPEIKEDFIHLLPKKPENCKVILVTTAAEDINGVYLEEGKQLLHDCGIKNIQELDIKDKTEKELKNILAGSDIVYINGGNTFRLLYWVKKSGFDKVISKFKGLYVGVSAGSYIACPTIEMANWKHPDLNTIGIKDLTALNFVPFLIKAHFVEEEENYIKYKSKNTKYPIVALLDTQAILIKGIKFKIIGTGKKKYWNGFKEKLINKKEILIKKR